MAAQSWIRRLPSGRYRARYVAPDGKERGETFARRGDAVKWRDTQLADVARGRWVDPALGKMTFAEYANDVWKPTLTGIEDSTFALNVGVLDNHLLDRFGRAPLAEIGRADVKAMVADDREDGYSPSSVRRHVIVLRMILGEAVEDGRIGRNVAEKVKLPAEQPRQMRFLTDGQLTAAADALGWYRPLVMTAGWVGPRWGELAGLAVTSVDLLRHTVRVDRALSEVNGKLRFKGPKTKAGRRVISIPAALSEILGVHFASEAVQSSGLAFPTVTGKPMRRNNFRTLWRGRIDGTKTREGVFAGTDLEGLVFHELRHTAAALMINEGAHPLTVKLRLGHSSIRVTMDVYGHLFPDQDEALAQALDARLREALESTSSTRRTTVTGIRRRS